MFDVAHVTLRDYPGGRVGRVGQVGPFGSGTSGGSGRSGRLGVGSRWIWEVGGLARSGDWIDWTRRGLTTSFVHTKRRGRLLPAGLRSCSVPLTRSGVAWGHKLYPQATSRTATPGGASGKSEASWYSLRLRNQTLQCRLDEHLERLGVDLAVIVSDADDDCVSASRVIRAGEAERLSRGQG
jgi:hypothetical protein